ncbi:hypothetical protein CEXT_767151 [Caerostris extrusa]|uniref:Uncharacterized protein n=1 Tax=Caerostris extrusa TaxID=172846 RepID=A0AAV4P5X1_CAEEX|nr:hypothetical protein CEXT_767151 [Caerostris extrusa]
METVSVEGQEQAEADSWHKEAQTALFAPVHMSGSRSWVKRDQHAQCGIAVAKCNGHWVLPASNDVRSTVRHTPCALGVANGWVCCLLPPGAMDVNVILHGPAAQFPASSCV